jgi:hypothetical protein
MIYAYRGVEPKPQGLTQSRLYVVKQDKGVSVQCHYLKNADKGVSVIYVFEERIT